MDRGKLFQHSGSKIELCKLATERLEREDLGRRIEVPAGGRR
jgi:hypothetical protein